MNYLKMLPAWGIVTIILLISAAFFKFCLRGYGYIAAALLFFAVLIVISKLAPVWLRRGVMALVLVGFAYFIYVEIPIIKNARTEEGRPCGPKRKACRGKSENTLFTFS